MADVTFDDDLQAPADGRTLRAARSRTLVVEAFLDLVSEGEAHPTAQQVSDRSGVSMRSIFRLFDDVDALHSEAVGMQIERVLPLLVHIDSQGPLRRRVTELIDSRALLFEAISPVRRLAVRLRDTSPRISAHLDAANSLLRSQVATVFADELMTQPPTRRSDTLELLDLLTSWETWERLRVAQSVSSRRARTLIVRAIHDVLT